MQSRKFYMRGADGKLYDEKEDGSFTPVQFPQGTTYIETNHGVIAVLPDEQAKVAESQKKYAELFSEPVDPKAAKQVLKRQELLKKQLETMVRDQVDPSRSSPNFIVVKDEKFMDLHAQYRLANAAGQGKDCEFQPLSTYAHKVLRIRPMFKGEVGYMKGVNGGPDRIVVLESGYGQGDTVSVPEQLETLSFDESREMVKVFDQVMNPQPVEEPDPFPSTAPSDLDTDPSEEDGAE